MKLKYIIYDGYQVLLFPCFTNHSDFASFNPERAGIVQLITDEDGDLEIFCSGRCLSLNLESSQKKDASIILAAIAASSTMP